MSSSLTDWTSSTVLLATSFCFLCGMHARNFRSLQWISKPSRSEFATARRCSGEAALEAELSQSSADPEPPSEPSRTLQSSPASPDDPYTWLQQNYERTPKATQASHQQSGMEELKTFMDSLDRSASPQTADDI